MQFISLRVPDRIMNFSCGEHSPCNLLVYRCRMKFLASEIDNSPRAFHYLVGVACISKPQVSPTSLMEHLFAPGSEGERGSLGKPKVEGQAWNVQKGGLCGGCAGVVRAFGSHRPKTATAQRCRRTLSNVCFASARTRGR